ncbi:MAG: MarR family transcriptional regulator [Microthrixaceae bacterium]
MERTRWLDDVESRAWRGFQEMQMRLTAEIGRRLSAASGLSAQDYAVLVMLTDRGDGRARLYQLSESLGWEKSRLSHHINRMEKRGLVRKERCDEDRRGAFVAVTDQGRSAIEAAAPGHVSDVRELFVDRLGTKQLEAMASIAEEILAGLDRSERAEEPGAA